MIGQKLLPYEGVQLNSSELYIKETETLFIKNMTYDEKLGMFTPVMGTELIKADFVYPAGNSYVIGSGNVDQMGHVYIMCHNSAGNHFIYRIKGDNGEQEMVSVRPEWNFQRKPEYFINPKTRFTSHVFTRYNKITKKEEQVTYIIFTDGYNPTRFLCVEDCIATNSFTTSYFNVPGQLTYLNDYLNLGVATPLDCISVTEVKRDTADAVEMQKPNLISFKGWQFRIKYWNVWNQDSEHGVISTQYINVSGNGCIENSQALARVLRLKFKAGFPTIDRIQIEFRNYTGKSAGLSTASDWFLHDTIHCFKEDDTKKWWERSRNNPWQEAYDTAILAGNSPAQATIVADKKELLKYNAVDNTFEYFFAADKQWTPLPVTETNRIENALPRLSGSAFSINKNIGLANNMLGFPTLPTDTLDKIKFNITPPATEDPSCKVKLRKITIWGCIWNPHDSAVVPIMKKDGSVVFGWADCTKNNPFSYDQVLPADASGVNQEGIIGCLRGTKAYSISKQYAYNATTGEFKDVGVDPATYLPELGINRYAMQKWEFEVLPGTYIFQIASHKSLPSDDYQKTSTFTIGQTDITNLGGLVNRNRELIIDCSAGDVEIKANPMMIYDLTRKGKGCTFADASSVNCGYLYEDQIETRPISGANVVMSRGIDEISSFTTDHNGFFFASTRQNALEIYLYGRKNGTIALLKTTARTNDTPFTEHYKFDKYYVFENKDPYNNLDRIKVSGRITLCGNTSVGVAGVLVILSGGGYAITDSNGFYSIISHDQMFHTNDRGSQQVNPTASGFLYVAQRGACQIVACDNSPACTWSFSVTNFTYPAYTGIPRTTTVADVVVRIRGLNLRGPKMGGRYQLGIATHDWLGRISPVQIKDDYIVNIPSLQQTKSFAFSQISYAINSGIRFPDYVRKISFFITDNLAFDDAIDWVAERVQYVDNSGTENKQAPTKIRFYYESLSEYNKLNQFATTVNWQFITNDQAVVVGDMVQVLANGDGVIADKVVNTLVSYDKEGKYIQVEYSDELKGLTDGCLLKIIRPTQSQEKQFMYELCPVIDVVNGVPVTLNGDFNFYDSYMLNRQIPVPVEKKKSKDEYGKEIITDENVNEIRNYPFLFEHHSPSDKWGDHCRTRGRVNVSNPYQNQLRFSTEIAMSKVIMDNGIINGLHYFSEADRVRFDVNEWGGITGVLPELNFLMVICELDTFVVGYNDNSVRVGANGQVQASTSDRGFGRPERKFGNNYGCQYIDVATIAKMDGIVCFVDRANSCVVSHNYSEAKSLTDRCARLWFINKIQHVLNGNKYFHGVIDPRNKDYILSSFDIKDTYAEADFVNDMPRVLDFKNETVAFNIYTGFMRFFGFVPEFMTYLVSDTMPIQQLISFKRGKAYKHYGTSVKYMNFYGQQCHPFVWSISNIDNTKMKKFLSIEVYCSDVQFIVYDAYTSAKQSSRISKKWFSKREKFYAASFLCDLNTVLDINKPVQTGANKLLDGDLLYGQWIVACLTTIPEDEGKFFQWTGNIINILQSEKSSNQ